MKAPLAEPGLVQRHPEVRWLAMAAVVVGVVAAAVSYLPGAFRDNSNAPLRVASPAQVVSDVRAEHVGGYSGTILARVDLDLPGSVLSMLSDELPIGGSLANGWHTIKYWYGDATRQRTAILDRNVEQDVFRNGNRVLLWDPRSHIYSRHSIASSKPSIPLTLGAVALTPPQLTARLLSLADARSTSISLRSGDPVDGRSTYELLVRPTDSRSLIGSVHIDIDGRQAVPLRVQIYPRNSAEPAVDVYFTSITFADPPQSNFTFDPPPDAHPHQAGPLQLTGTRTIGTDWLSVVSYRTEKPEAAIIRSLFGDGMRAVKGRWGSGRVYRNDMLSVLLTNDGRLFFGAVDRSVLYAAAGK